MTVFTGKTVEQAIEQGLLHLGLARSQVSIRVLKREKKGFLGLFGHQCAQVDLSALPSISDLEEGSSFLPHPDRVITAECTIHQDETKGIPIQGTMKPIATDDAMLTTGEIFSTVASKTVGDELVEDGDIERVCQDVRAYIDNIINEMDLEASIDIQRGRRQFILQIETSEPGRLIGYHGKVLKSLQLLAQHYLHNHYSRHFTVLLNVHDYLEHRTETLIDMAKKVGLRVLESGRPYYMNPMTNGERKIVHKTISHLAGLESYSEGDDPNRYVVVVRRD